MTTPSAVARISGSRRLDAARKGGGLLRRVSGTDRATNIQCGSGGRGRPLRRRPQIEVAVGDAWRRNAEDGRDDEGDRDSEQERIDWRQRRCRQAGEDEGRGEPVGRAEERRVGEEGGSACRTRWTPKH